MAEFPALPFFTDAYLADTRHLTTEEHGAYLLLLMCAWRRRGCLLKDDDRFLARTVGVSPQRWRRLKPVMMEFFDVSDGVWRQKKLTDVYQNVEERVARNRANGAKGGRARAAKQLAAQHKGAQPKETGAGQAVATPTGQATKIQKPKPKPAAAPCQNELDENALGQIADAACLDRLAMDTSPLVEWSAAGADITLDILPVIRRLRMRQQRKTGASPRALAYYGQAILEARDKRLGAGTSGAAYAGSHPPSPAKRLFDTASADDWRLFLGDADNRFRGDYLSANWQIGPDHPVFIAARLGPDPRARFNPLIPHEIRACYGPAWRWAMQAGEKGG